MNAGHRTVAIYFGLFSVVIFAGLVLFAPVPPWTWPVAVPLVVVAFVVARVARRVPDRAPEPEPYVAPAFPEPLEHRVVEVALPSKEEDYDFLFSATVRWIPVVGAGNGAVGGSAAPAVEAILARATRITQDRPPGRVSLVQHELNGALCLLQADATGTLRAMADLVSLTLSENDRKRLDELAGIRKDKAVWEHARKYEQSKREYLSSDVLKDTGSAVVWWLVKNDDQVEKTVNDLGTLAQLSSAANNQDVPERFRHLLPWPDSYSSAGATVPDLDGAGAASPPRDGMSPSDCFAAFLQTMDFRDGDPQRAVLSRQVADIVAMHGRRQVADELISRFDEPSASETDDGGPSPDGPDEGPP